jgi:hypothetical protein
MLEPMKFGAQTLLVPHNSGSPIREPAEHHGYP